MRNLTTSRLCTHRGQRSDLMRRFAGFGLLAVAAAGFSVAALPALAGDAASPWVDGHNVRTRLVAGVVEGTGSDGRILGGVEIEMADGWKTYWKNPGDAGGVPPSFDFSGSSNVRSANVLYPAPHRMTDKAGTTIGYKTRVVFPVEIEAATAGQPVTLKLDFAFGTCREICVPGEATHEVTLEPGDGAPRVPASVTEALARVPVAAGKTPGPALTRSVVSLDGTPPKIVLHADFPAGREGADAFVMGPDGEYVPLPVATAEEGRSGVVFEIDLSLGADVKALAGKPIEVTLVSKHGASTHRVVVTPSP